MTRKRGAAICCMIAMLITGCGKVNYTEETAQTIELEKQTEQEVSTSPSPTEKEEITGESENVLPSAPAELKGLNAIQDAAEWDPIMQQYCEESADYWNTVLENKLRWGESIPGLGVYEALSMFAIWSALDPAKNTLLYFDMPQVVKSGAGGMYEFFDPLIENGGDIAVDENKFYKMHMICGHDGTGELYMRLKDPEGKIVWEHVQEKGCEQIFCDLDLEMSGTYQFTVETNSGEPYPGVFLYEIYGLTEKENEKANMEYEAL